MGPEQEREELNKKREKGEFKREKEGKKEQRKCAYVF